MPKRRAESLYGNYPRGAGQCASQWHAYELARRRQHPLHNFTFLAFFLLSRRAAALIDLHGSGIPGNFRNRAWSTELRDHRVASVNRSGLHQAIIGGS